MSDPYDNPRSRLFNKLLVQIEAGEITREEAVEILVRNGANRVDAREIIYPRDENPWRT